MDDIVQTPHIKIVEFINNIITTIHEYYGMTPTILIKWGSQDPTIHGMYDIRSRVIEISVPDNLKMTMRIKDEIRVTIVHEYAHFLLSCKFKSTKEAMADMRRYWDDPKYKQHDEQRTWKVTGEVAKTIGFWNKPFQKMCLDLFKYSWVLKEEV